MERQRAKLIIVGAGILGAAYAYFARRYFQQNDIIVLSQTPPGHGASTSASSWGWVNAHTDDPDYFAFRYTSLHLWAALHHTHPDWAIRCQSSIVSDLSTDDLQNWSNFLHDGGSPSAYLSANALRDYLVECANPPKDAIHTKGEYAVEAELVTQQLFAQAHINPQQTQVHALIREDNRITGVWSDHGPLLADQVILCTGHGTPSLLASIGVDFALNSSRGILVHTSPVNKTIEHMYMANNYHMRQKPDGCLLIGGPFGSTQNSAEIPTDRFVSDLCAQIAHDFGLEQTPTPTRITHGTRVLPMDSLPKIGPARDMQGTLLTGLYVNAMHSGVTNAPLAAKLGLAEIMTGNRDALLEKFGLQPEGGA